MKRTVPISDEQSLQQTLSSIQFPCSIEISYLIRKSSRYNFRDDLPEKFGFAEFEGAWGFNSPRTLYDTMSVSDIGRMTLALHENVSLTIDEFTRDEYVVHVRRKNGMMDGPDGWVPATENQIREHYAKIKDRTSCMVPA